MNDLLPFIPGELNKAMASVPLFMPEIYLTVLFIVVLVTDLLFGITSAKLCKIVACAGMLIVVFKDLEQFVLLVHSNGYFLFGQMLLLRHETVVFKLLIDVLAFILLLYFSWDNELKAHRKGLSDLYTLTIASIFGLHLMVMAVNLLSIYLSVEMVSIASYLLVAYHSENKLSAEAGLKYVLFGASASAIMLYGISLLYGFGGSLDLFGGTMLTALMQANGLAVSFALVLVLIGIGFKLSFVPMQFWVPDVYQGAPTPVTAYLSVLPKIAGFSLLINFLLPFVHNSNWHACDFRLFLSVIGIVTMIAGNFAAVMQNNVKRMLAYSSIGHTGFALMAIVTFSTQEISALTFYLTAYTLANIAALMLANYFANAAGVHEIDDYKGLGFKYPLAGVCFVIILVSLTGLPVTAGFTGKLLVFSAVYSVYQQDHDTLLLLLMITGALTTVVSLFYYIKIPLNLFLKKSEFHSESVVLPANLVVAAFLISIVLILLGIFPQYLMKIL